MNALSLLDRLPVLAAVALLGLGVWAAIAARPFLKQALGVLIAQAAAAALFVIAAPQAGGLAIGAVLLGAAVFIVLCAIAVRLREVYGSGEADDIDQIDDTARPEVPEA